MNDSFTDELPLGLFSKNPDRVLGIPSSNATLHYCSPAHGGWGVVRTGLLVPESYLLFVCPAACGRHGAIAAIEQGYKERVGYLCIEDREIVLGDYESEIARGVEEAIRRLRPRPRAFIICVSCIDDLLGTDHDAALQEFEARYKIPFRLARMNPITMDGKLPPGQRIQRTLYEFLRSSDERDGGINLLGCFRPLAPDSELHRLCEALGRGPLRHPGGCATFDEFLTLGKSGGTLVLRPEGAAAAAYCETEFGIPALPAHIAYSETLTLRRLRSAATFIAKNSASRDTVPSADRERILSPDGLESFLAPDIADARDAAKEAAETLAGMSVAVDSTATASPFDLALSLREAGIEVARIYVETFPAHERESMERLAELAPEILVCNPRHSRRFLGQPDRPLADIAIGFEAGYATRAPRTLPLSFDEGLYGFHGRASVFRALAGCAREEATDLESQVKAYGLVI